MMRISMIMSGITVRGSFRSGRFEDHDLKAGALSGGWKKRLAIVRQLAREPDLILMDEPTNPLMSRESSGWKKLISTASFATLTVSHAGRFLESNRQSHH